MSVHCVADEKEVAFVLEQLRRIDTDDVTNPGPESSCI